MPKTVPGIPDEVLLRELDNLAASILITPAQAGLLLSRTPGQLAEDRAAGNPPQFVKIGGTNRYRIGDIRALIKNNVFRNTAEASLAKESRAAGYDLRSFSAFLANGRAEDTWPFAMVAGKPIEFFYSLTLEVADEVDCDWLDKAEYITLLQTLIKAEKAAEEKTKIESDLAIKNLPDSKTHGAQGPL